jgi:hypothetical protein
MGVKTYPKESCEIFFDGQVIVLNDYKEITHYNSKGKTYEDILKDYETLKTQSKNTNNMSVLNPRLFNKKSTQNSTNV